MLNWRKMAKKIAMTQPMKSEDEGHGTFGRVERKER